MIYFVHLLCFQCFLFKVTKLRKTKFVVTSTLLNIVFTKSLAKASLYVLLTRTHVVAFCESLKTVSRSTFLAHSRLSIEVEMAMHHVIRTISYFWYHAFSWLPWKWVEESKIVSCKTVRKSHIMNHNTAI